MKKDHMGLRITAVVVFLIIGVLSFIIRLNLFLGNTFLIGYMISVLAFGAAYSIWKSDYKAPKIGIWLSVVIILLAIIEVALLYFLESDHLFSHDVTLNPLYLDIPVVMFSIISFGICIRLLNVENEKFSEEMKDRKREGSDNHGNCPNCGYDEVEFIDGIDYRCTRCGEIY